MIFNMNMWCQPRTQYKAWSDTNIPIFKDLYVFKSPRSSFFLNSSVQNYPNISVKWHFFTEARRPFLIIIIIIPLETSDLWLTLFVLFHPKRNETGWKFFPQGSIKTSNTYSFIVLKLILLSDFLLFPAGAMWMEHRYRRRICCISSQIYD